MRRYVDGPKAQPQRRLFRFDCVPWSPGVSGLTLSGLTNNFTNIVVKTGSDHGLVLYHHDEDVRMQRKRLHCWYQDINYVVRWAVTEATPEDHNPIVIFTFITAASISHIHQIFSLLCPLRHICLAVLPIPASSRGLWTNHSTTLHPRDFEIFF
jgi:hypothetical protein